MPESKLLLDRAGGSVDDGVITIGSAREITAFITAAKNGRVGDCEPKERPL